MTITATPLKSQPISKLAYPKTFIIGAAKSGTTTICNVLKDHPQIHLPETKEPSFFAWDEQYEQGLEHYAALYEEAEEGQILLDGSTPYSRCTVYPEAARRIFEAVPDAKFVYLMRHPVDRAFSHYCHRWLKEVRKGEPFTETFKEYVQNDPMCIDDSLYKLQIEQYLQYFPKNRFLFLLTEDLGKDKIELAQKICRHFGIDDARENFDSGQANSNVTSEYREILVKNTVRDFPLIKLVKPLLSSSTKEWLYNNVLRKTSFVNKKVSGFKPIPMASETRQELLEFYRETTQWVEELTGRDLPHWYQ
ncbi:MAG: sulfotransferase [Jaaginema sp. PMC 1079.18]|nr:sulfotransferase [Jaaginema sp. PMC 1080.18]MEC4849854.1 sulfotransferase [Jaaginema sp. PMC 1079.18]MEC4865242.1 sulfotransferase [Jaaginema sp. PMC 1078.18]